MATSDERRREVAENLRDIDEASPTLVDDLEEDPLRFGGLAMAGILACVDDRAVFRRLADLIDPTCEDTATHHEDASAPGKKISGDERQRAADELRNASTGAYRHVDALDVIAGSVGVDVEGKYSHEVEAETYAALANLIDPTCTGRLRIVEDEDEDGRPVHRTCCSRCGARMYGSWRYCAKCGARIVMSRAGENASRSMPLGGRGPA